MRMYLQTTLGTSRIDRRHALRTGGVLAGAAARLSSIPAARAQESMGTLVFDMACDGRTFRLNRVGEIGLPVVGDTFIVNGSIYPANAFDDGVTGPDDPGAIGRWICQRTFMVDAESGVTPDVFTTVLFALGDGISATAGQLDAAPDGLISIGIEGGPPDVHRAISGGYGQYADARGAVLQAVHSENETMIQVAPEVAVPAPNFRYTFHFA